MLRSLANGEDAEARPDDGETAISAPLSATLPDQMSRYRVMRIEPGAINPTASALADHRTEWAERRVARVPGGRGRLLLALGLIGYALLNLGDLVTTGIGLTMGLHEGNPLMNRLLAAYGFDALVVYKVLVVVLVTLGITYLMRQHQRVAAATLVLCSLLVGFAVVSNLAQFAVLAHALTF